MARLLLLLRIAVVCAVVKLAISNHNQCIFYGVRVYFESCGRAIPVTDATFGFDRGEAEHQSFGNYDIKLPCDLVSNAILTPVTVTAEGFDQRTISLYNLLVDPELRLQCSDPSSCYPYKTELKLTSECNEPLGQLTATILSDGDVQKLGSDTFVIGYCLPGSVIVLRDEDRDVAYEILETGSRSISIECSEDAAANGANRVDGNWGIWGEPGVCSVSCGKGTRPRQRLCNSPPPQNGGRNCDKLSTDTVPCFLRDCPVDGKWSAWLQWSNCDIPCSDVESIKGTQTRLRVCNNPAPSFGGVPCIGSTNEQRSCEPELLRCSPLPPEPVSKVIDGGWTNWSTWSVCARRKRDIEHARHRRGGIETRSRTCDNPPPSNGGADCVGSSTETADCDT